MLPTIPIEHRPPSSAGGGLAHASAYDDDELRERSAMAWVFAVPVVGFVVLLVIGSITGRVEVKSCCGVADPRCDVRLRDVAGSRQPAAGAEKTPARLGAAPPRRRRFDSPVAGTGVG
jgi:hypothetical protein